MSTVLHGYCYSVYTRIAKMVLLEKEVDFDYQEIDPFSEDVPTAYLHLHPFNRVPAFQHGDFTVYETSAITRYINETFPGRDLIPDDKQARARLSQLLSIIDNYAYWPLVRQIFSNSYFLPHFDQPSDLPDLEAGLKSAPDILKVLDGICSEGLVLRPKATTIADLHLAPMMAYFMMTEEGQDLMSGYPALGKWWSEICDLQSLTATAPQF